MSDKEQQRLRLRAALDEAAHMLDMQKPLPGYLVDALEKYQSALRKRITRELLAPKLVQRHTRAGLPKTKKPSKGQGAFEKTAEQLGISESTVERAFRDHPPDLDEI